MKCEKCNTPLNYGAKYCSACGEKISKEMQAEEYNHTIWGKFQIAEDWYSKLSFQKYTGHILVKIIVLVAILACGGYQLWQNGSELKILASDSYSVAYNESADEYYIRTAQQETNLNLYIPPFAEQVRLIGYNADGNVMEEKNLSKNEWEEKDAFKIVKNEFAYTTVRLVKNDKLSEIMKFYITD